jgi:DNA-binding XRE family transcriptional regulator
MMIKNECQYKSAIKQIESFRYAINATRNNHLPDHANKARKTKIDNQIDELIRQCDEYKTTRNSIPSMLSVKSQRDLRVLPIKFRISAGMTIDAFSKYVNVTRIQIQRWEKDEYNNITLKNFLKIIEILDIDITA